MDVAAELRDLAQRNATGCVDVLSARVSGQMWISEGRVQSVSLSSAAPALGMRLVSGGRLSLTNLGAALSMHQQYPHLRLGDALVRMGVVTREEVEAVAWEQTCDDVATLLGLPDPTVTFTPASGAPSPAPGPTIGDVLAAATSRMDRWQEMVRDLGGPDTVPALADALLNAPDASLRPEEWAVLCRVDGRRSLMSIARQAGFTTLEAASILQGLLAAGLVSVPTPAHLPPPSVSPAPVPAVPPAPVPAVSPAAVTPTPTPPAPPPPAPVAASSPPAPAAVAAEPVTDLFDDPSDLLRELSEIGGFDTSTRRRLR